MASVAASDGKAGGHAAVADESCGKARFETVSCLSFREPAPRDVMGREVGAVPPLTDSGDFRGALPPR
jgi:hypothetical protein